MVDKALGTLYQSNGSFFLTLKKSFIEDSGCSFEKGDKLQVRMIDKHTMMVYKDVKKDSLVDDDSKKS